MDDLQIFIKLKDIDNLNSLGKRRGFSYNSKKAWTLLLNANRDTESIAYVELPAELEHQIWLDVNRSFTKSTQLSHDYSSVHEKRILSQRDRLFNIISTCFRKYPFLNYYQGFHDICQVLLLVLGEKRATEAAQSLALYWLRDHMEPSMEGSVDQMEFVMLIIKEVDPEIYWFLNSVEGFQSYFCVSWLLTWFSHDITNLKLVRRLFDLFISSPPTMPLFLTAQIVIENKAELMLQNLEFSCVHNFLTNLRIIPEESEKTINNALAMYTKYGFEKKVRRHFCEQSCMRSGVNNANEVMDKMEKCIQLRKERKTKKSSPSVNLKALIMSSGIVLCSALIAYIYT